ncbi:hypothetical protein MTO96_014819 [Rhipicephalus appendiculatus]
MLGAEIIAMSAAIESHFSIDATSCMLEKVKAEVALNAARLQVYRAANVAEARRLQRRAFAMFGCCFSAAFTVIAVIELVRPCRPLPVPGTTGLPMPPVSWPSQCCTRRWRRSARFRRVVC